MSKRFSSDRGPSQRQLRAGELVRHALVQILQREELREPELQGVSVTVTEVRMTPDLKQAAVFCTALGGALSNDRRGTAVVASLNKSAPYMRGELGKRIDMKFTPQLTFRYDDSFDTARHIDQLLSRPEVQRDLPAGDPSRDDD
ncbi:30S ribosome-binding factor RbfA [Aquisalinus flavus]|uniref:Ribosome-binding factor A n=1 Tax=Aquisalinus flavus TaxID=1526572 RepID=A0A8J2V7T8_9PROT|nr:30S ribosome-binding factor RbfA [Aquisalinus flavus]MBD0425389.1 30S ribosome-binding factor RbfA [Aquisalinus flavus]UNE48964.1 30S ribosome-binding factor RbfA [Aquisalinus flavus]GGD16468.1 ribosome-binding factor A [Aquisalinus flavus]